ncbi:MAG: DUF2786 domain-containing protein [Acidobacteriota bacterium]
MQRFWTEQLYREYESLCYQYRLGLSKPAIEVAPMAGGWGSWDPVSRTIRLATRLISNYSWDIVLEILKHEVAHQMVTDIHRSDETHGPLFREACDRLCVASWAAHAGVDLGQPLIHWRDTPAGGREERLLKKAEKLLALATSGNEHEAALAMQRVQQLYQRHNLERIKAREQAGQVYLLIQMGKKRIERHESLIASILVEHFSVEVIHTSLYDAARLSEYKALELLGTPENVRMAEYVFHFLQNQSQLLWQRYRSQTGKDARNRRSYLLGLLNGFREKLEQHRSQPHPWSLDGGSAQALVRLMKSEKRRLNAFVRQRHPRLFRKHWGRRRHDRQAYVAGVAEGRNLTLNKPLSSSARNRGLLLKS